MSYLSRRPKDLHSTCYMFDIRGHCSYGLLCRFGQYHIDPITGHNVTVPRPNQNYIESLNKYLPLLKHLLRRKKYNYTLSDHLVKLANKQITKANVVKRNSSSNIDDDQTNGRDHDNNSIEDKKDRSLVDIYYSALKTNNQIQEEVKFKLNLISSMIESIDPC